MAKEGDPPQIASPQGRAEEPLDQKYTEKRGGTLHFTNIHTSLPGKKTRTPTDEGGGGAVYIEEPSAKKKRGAPQGTKGSEKCSRKGSRNHSEKNKPEPGKSPTNSPNLKPRREKLTKPHRKALREGPERPFFAPSSRNGKDEPRSPQEKKRDQDPLLGGRLPLCKNRPSNKTGGGRPKKKKSGFLPPQSAEGKKLPTQNRKGEKRKCNSAGEKKRSGPKISHNKKKRERLTSPQKKRQFLSVVGFWGGGRGGPGRKSGGGRSGFARGGKVLRDERLKKIDAGGVSVWRCTTFPRLCLTDRSGRRAGRYS